MKYLILLFKVIINIAAAFFLLVTQPLIIIPALGGIVIFVIAYKMLS